MKKQNYIDEMRMETVSLAFLIIWAHTEGLARTLENKIKNVGKCWERKRRKKRNMFPRQLIFFKDYMAI